MKSYREIDLDDTPIVALSCSHFFTTESLDGLVGLSSVYDVDVHGTFTGLADSPQMISVPRCPDCKKAIKQHATRRYNRVVNIAVMNETAKRFVVKGQLGVQKLNSLVDEAAAQLPERSRWVPGSLKEDLSQRHAHLARLARQVRRFCASMGAEQQPSRKLFDAIVAAKTKACLDTQLADLSLQDQLPRPGAPDHTSVYGGEFLHLRIQEIIIQDHIQLLSKIDADIVQPGQDLASTIKAFQEKCDAFITRATDQNLPRFAVTASIAYARVFRGAQAVIRKLPLNEAAINEASAEKARTLLKKAELMCQASFHGAKELMVDVSKMVKLLRSPWYEAVTPDELAAIKAAMLGGRDGIATHSGHWYQCQNGHPVRTSIPKTRTVTNEGLAVCDWRVRYAHGKGQVPRVRCPDWGSGTHHGEWAKSSRALGEMRFVSERNYLRPGWSSACFTPAERRPLQQEDCWVREL